MDHILCSGIKRNIFTHVYLNGSYLVFPLPDTWFWLVGSCIHGLSWFIFT